MKNQIISTFFASCLMCGFAQASDDCTDPVVDWQPTEVLRQKMVGHGWEVKRIKVDDGCYEVKGVDGNGHHVEATFSPGSLTILELEIKFAGTGDGAAYLDRRCPIPGDELTTSDSDTE